MLPNFRKSEPDLRGMSAPSPAVQPSPSTSTFGARPAANRGTGGPSLIGSDLTITGNLVSKGEIQVDGEVQGDIHGTNVVIGERAHITGGIVAEEVVVRGHVMGSVRGKRVMLQSTCRVEGDVYHQALSIEQGAYFEGKSRRSDDPLAVQAQQRPQPAPAETSAQPAPIAAPASNPVPQA